ncbi:MAG TPA: lamin tail domain-containing protein [Cyclobacteriaceae bacterium]
MVVALDVEAQFTDSFTDNDFTNDPSWQGDNSKFVIDNSQLKLQALAEASHAFLSTPSFSINNAQWQFFVKLEFNPSSSNYARIYIVSDQADLSAPLNGYFVLIGDTPDEISLYKQAGTAMTKIIDGVDGTVNSSFVEVLIKVTRDNMGNWELFIDVGNSGSFISQGAVTDNTFDASSNFGVFCNYTSTRSDKFYFDDFIVTGDSYIDTTPPLVNLIETISANKLIIRFNEEVDPITSIDLTNYSVGNGIGNPSGVELLPDQKSVELTFNSNFENGVSQTILISKVTDIAGNIITNSTNPFLYFITVPALPKDIIFTEILADPSPQVGLPDAEYIEIYNRSSNPFDLNNWIFSDGNSMAILPTQIILPGTYWIITSTANSSKFGLTTNVIGVSNFPTLNNSTDTLTFKTPQGQTIDSLNYDLSWYRSVDKQEGGWALELIDPHNPCGEEDNWTSSEDDNGGTPGFVNSVIANKPDLTGPQLTSLNVITSNKLRLTFNEKLKSSTSLSTTIAITPDPGITDIYFDTKALRSLIIELSSPLTTKQLYSITVNNIFDCNGNPIDVDYSQMAFALPEEAEEGDVLINEILFNPRPGGVDFVELYNYSDKYIDLKNWSIANFNGAHVNNSKNLSSVSLTIAPNEYFVVTSDAFILKDHYPLGKEDQFIKASLPTFPDDEGSVAIASESGLVIDYFYYDKSFHSKFIKDEDGVSLERISVIENTNEPSNWTSASSTIGFATPGYINSNFRPDNILSVGEVSIEPTVFSPFTTGSNFSQINFNFDQTGFVANIKIVDHQGRLIKTIANNAILGFNGFFRWDGDHDDGTRARAGYYIVWFEVFNASGLLKTYRERVIIALR